MALIPIRGEGVGGLGLMGSQESRWWWYEVLPQKERVIPKNTELAFPLSSPALSTSYSSLSVASPFLSS